MGAGGGLDLVGPCEEPGGAGHRPAVGGWRRKDRAGL